MFLELFPHLHFSIPFRFFFFFFFFMNNYPKDLDFAFLKKLLKSYLGFGEAAHFIYCFIKGIL